MKNNEWTCKLSIEVREGIDGTKAYDAFDEQGEPLLIDPFPALFIKVLMSFDDEVRELFVDISHDRRILDILCAKGAAENLGEAIAQESRAFSEAFGHALFRKMLGLKPDP